MDGATTNDDNTKDEIPSSSTTEQQQQPSSSTTGFPGPGLGLRQTAAMARILADDAGRAFGNLMPTNALQQLTTRKYTLPDKTVGSQVLMYRQLLHTQCRPGLKLSRDYQGTAAQMAVMHMPWWEEGIETTKKMIISYDNLITRLWLNGAIDPFIPSSSPSVIKKKEETKIEQVVDLLDMGTSPPPQPTSSADEDVNTIASVETFMTDAGLPPIPHEFWVDRLGFQQPDPVTDFRSGGVLSLGMLVYMVESQPGICQRFFTGDAKVLPFGITCINVTDMIAKFLMLAKSTDRMDALLSQKPFWKMFADPNAILAVQELSMDMLADVVVELERERKVPSLAKLHSNGTPGEPSDKVTVFDFSTILERTERRVRDELLGAGPKTVTELRSIAHRLQIKYKNQLERRISRALGATSQQDLAVDSSAPPPPISSPITRLPMTPPPLKEVLGKAGDAAGAMAGAAGAMAGAAGVMAGGFFSKVKTGAAASAAAIGQVGKTSYSSPSSSQVVTTTTETTTTTTPSLQQQPMPTIVDLPPLTSTVTPASTPSPAPRMASNISDDGDWAGMDIAPATNAISNFSIGDDEDEDDFL